MRRKPTIVISILTVCIIFFSTKQAISQSCTGCTISYTSDEYGDISVASGETVCVLPGVTCYGNVYMEGGTLCNSGSIANINITDLGGIIDNYGDIESSQENLELSNDLTINNYPFHSFTFHNALNVEMLGSTVTYLNFYNNSNFKCYSELIFNYGSVYLSAGITWTGDPSFLGESKLDFKDLTFNDSEVTIESSERGNITVGGSLILDGTSTKSINNSGSLVVTDILRNSNSTITNNGYVLVQSKLNNIGGTYENNNETYLGSLYNLSSAVLQNSGVLGIAGTFTNSGSVNLSTESILSSSDYYNTGTIDGPALTGTLSSNYDNWAKILIYGFSRNTGVLNENTLVFDVTLDASDDNIDYGFDEIINPANILSPVRFVITSLGSSSIPTTTVDCAAANSEYWLKLGVWKAKSSLCLGESIDLKASLTFQLQLPSDINQPPVTPLPTPSYVWIPGSTAGQTIVVTPSVTTIYTVTATYNNCSYTNTISVDVKAECEEEIVGCCFGNYGASVWINNSNTYLNVYCNVINELGLTNNVTQNGEFQSESGYLRVLLNWYHNARNLLYIPSNTNTVAPTWGPNIGVTSFFGASQKIKGNSNTSFNNLWLEGTGPKSIWINEFGHGNLELNDKVFLLQNYVFAMKNQTANVARTLGYATTETSGYFSRLIADASTVTNQKYLFPLGAEATSLSQFRYRPLVIANNANSQSDEISANFMNIPPSLLSDPVFTHPTLTNTITMQSPSVLQINNSYYHKIKNTSPPQVTSSLSIKSYYYLPSDGFYQSIAEWETGPTQTYDWWGTTPGSNSSTITSVDPGTSGLVYAQTTGTLNFLHQPFALSKAGFYLNTNSFGNQGNGNGTTFSVSGSSYGGGGTPTGGGLGNVFGTGGNSGNNGSGGITTFTPSPVSGEYVISVTPPDNCQVPGKIRFVVDQNGNIPSVDVLYGITGVSGYLGQLSEEVYSIDYNNSGLILLSSPKELLKSCVNNMTICTSGSSENYIVDVTNNSENLVIKLPSTSVNNAISYGSLNIYNSSHALVPISAVTLTPGSTNNIIPVTPFVPGVYLFEFLVIASTSPPISETVKGQFIVK